MLKFGFWGQLVSAGTTGAEEFAEVSNGEGAVVMGEKGAIGAIARKADFVWIGG